MNIVTLVKSLNEDLGREYSHMMFYLAAETNVTGLHREELSEFFAKEADGERAHVAEFRRMITGLATRHGIGGVPNPNVAPYNATLTCPVAILKEALRMEDEVVENYVNRIDDAIALQENGEQDKVDGKWVELFLEEQILDSRADADQIREMLVNLGHKPD